MKDKEEPFFSPLAAATNGLQSLYTCLGLVCGPGGPVLASTLGAGSLVPSPQRHAGFSLAICRGLACGPGGPVFASTLDGFQL